MSIGGTLEELISAVLRGAAAIVGCSSTNLFLINERTQEIRIRLGLLAGSYPVIAAIGELLGSPLSEITIPAPQAQDSLVYQTWRQRTIHQTDSLAALVGSTFPASVVEQLAGLAGEHRFICVPAQGPTRNYGVLLFQKEGTEEFSRLQCAVLLRYARRIGEILEHSGTGQGLSLVSQLGTATTLENQLLQLTLEEEVTVISVDQDRRVTGCNSAAESLLGYAATDLMHRSLEVLFPEPESIAALLGGQLLEGETDQVDEPALLLRHDGTLLAARVETLLLADDHHAAAGFLLLVREDGPRERASLARQERLATMGEMAAQLAHEIRNPLVAIGATLESLVEDPDCTPALRATMGALTKEIVRLDMTLKKYLAARREMAFAEISLAEVVEDARLLLVNAYRLEGKTVTASVDPRLTVRADRDALRHVLFNLLHNALEASPADGDVSCHARGGRSLVAITVDDRGAGLSAPAAECLQPFFTTKKNGTGLGLAVCQSIVQAHGGLLQLTRRPEGGCRAVVSLPAAIRPRETV